MNERIKELAEQAGFIRFPPDEDSDIPIDWSCDYTQELARFAELIVKECIDIAFREGDTVDYLAVHFGVK